MYVFTRSIRLGSSGKIRDSIGWAFELTEKLNQISETPISLWRPLFSANAMSLTWGTVVEELEELEAVDAKLMADDTYVSLVERGTLYSSGDPVDDTLVSYVHGDFSKGADVQVVSVVETTLANGAFAKGVELGIEIAERVEEITGMSTAFGTHATGPYGRVQWMTGHASIADLQRAETAINSDPGFLQLLDSKVAEVYVQGSGEQRLARKLA